MRSAGAVAALVLAIAVACGGRGGLPPEVPPLAKGPDGKEYHMVARGPYKAYYDRWGRLQFIEQDSNGDRRPDRIAHHAGAKTPHLIEVDEDFDGRVDRWEEYDATGKLVKVGLTRRGGGPDLWVFPGAESGVPIRKEYDEDGDGRVDRAEVLQAGRVVRVELDTDRDGRMDRWQEWRGGRLVAEDLDTDRDGRPDRRLRYGAKGQLLGLEKLAAAAGR
jgi:hypothetical protein